MCTCVYNLTCESPLSTLYSLLSTRPLSWVRWVCTQAPLQVCIIIIDTIIHHILTNNAYLFDTDMMWDVALLIKTKRAQAVAVSQTKQVAADWLAGAGGAGGAGAEGESEVPLLVVDMNVREVFWGGAEAEDIKQVGVLYHNNRHNYT
jgi:hypothetical protein